MQPVISRPTLKTINQQQEVPLSTNYRSSHPGVFLGKGVLKICSKFTGEHSCRSVISVKLKSHF